MSRILYLSYESEKPSGGVKVIHTHVRLLRARGFDAYVLHPDREFRPAWLQECAPALATGGGFQLSPDDVVVIPEDHYQGLQALAAVPVRKFLFCQNHFYIFRGLGGQKTWQDFGVSEVFCCSHVIRTFIENQLGWKPVAVVPNSLPLGQLRPGSEKKLQIAYMPRKRAAETAFIQALFYRQFPQHREVAWLPLENLPETEVFRHLSESALFLSTSLYEGFGLPPLEAMACGCIVVGFHGYGGLEYANASNGFWVNEGELVECAGRLGDAIAGLKTQSAALETMRRAGLDTAAAFGETRQAQKLAAFWSARL